MYGLIFLPADIKDINKLTYSLIFGNTRHFHINFLDWSRVQSDCSQFLSYPEIR
jgi:hypothetical protein